MFPNMQASIDLGLTGSQETEEERRRRLQRQQQTSPMGGLGQLGMAAQALFGNARGVSN